MFTGSTKIMKILLNFGTVQILFGKKFSKFLWLKSQQTGIRLRVNTFGDSQSSSYTSPNNLPPERKNLT